MKAPAKKYQSGVEATLDVIGGKWKSIILYHLVTEKRRFNELRRLIPSISHKMLSQQLRELEQDGLVLRHDYNEVPPKVDYELSEYGSSLIGVLDFFCYWGETHVERVYGDKSIALEGPFMSEEEAAQFAGQTSFQKS